MEGGAPDRSSAPQRVIVVGVGVQGKKRRDVAGDDVVAIVDPAVEGVDFQRVEDVPPDSYDAALVAAPDGAKLGLLSYLIGAGKHVLVEKPLLAADGNDIGRLAALARERGVACYTAYNHRFEPNVARLEALIASGELGALYTARLFYGNGTARDVRNSAWRDSGAGVLSDLGSHLLDLARFLFGPDLGAFRLVSAHCFENQSPDHALFGNDGRPALQMETTLLAWRNDFAIDVFAERGSAHIRSLCKWGPSTFTRHKRVLPSGRPEEEAVTEAAGDPTWALEYAHFKRLCAEGGGNLDNDLWINEALGRLASEAAEAAPAGKGETP